jgi:hypothetical protein
MASNSGTASYTPSPLAKYLIGIFLLVGSAVLTYVVHFLPTLFGDLSIQSAIVALAYYGAHDLETGPPNGLPSWTTFAIVTVVAAVTGAVGFAPGMGAWTTGAVLVWFVAVLKLIYHAISEDAGASANPNAEAWALSLTGIGIGVLAYFAANPTAGLLVATTTVIQVIMLYVHVSTDGSTVTATPTPPPVPA